MLTKIHHFPHWRVDADVWQWCLVFHLLHFSALFLYPQITLGSVLLCQELSSVRRSLCWVQTWRQHCLCVAGGGWGRNNYNQWDGACLFWCLVGFKSHRVGYEAPKMKRWWGWNRLADGLVFCSLLTLTVFIAMICPALGTSGRCRRISN